MVLHVQRRRLRDSTQKCLSQTEHKVIKKKKETEDPTPVMAASFFNKLDYQIDIKRGRKHFSLITPVEGMSQSEGTIIGAAFFLFFLVL